MGSLCFPSTGSIGNDLNLGVEATSMDDTTQQDEDPRRCFEDETTGVKVARFPHQSEVTKIRAYVDV
jgi:hypothetical protein